MRSLRCLGGGVKRITQTQLFVCLGLALATLALFNAKVSNLEPLAETTKEPHFDKNMKLGQLLSDKKLKRLLRPKSNVDKIHTDILYFNRVPKTGSENFVFLLEKLGERNGFDHSRYRNPDHRAVSKAKQRSHVYSIMRRPRPLSYDRHVYFIDFRQFSNGNPTYMSVVRDPVQKFASRFHYARMDRGFIYKKLASQNMSLVQNLSMDAWIRKDLEECILTRDPECQMSLGQEYDLTIPYFCGQARECRILGSEWALEQAKSNVDQWYPVVGVLEEMNKTLSVLEHSIPQFFRGVTHLYFDDLQEPHKNRGRRRKPLSAKAESMLKANLTQEYEFFHFIKARLERQFASLDSTHVLVSKEEELSESADDATTSGTTMASTTTTNTEEVTNVLRPDTLT